MPALVPIIVTLLLTVPPVGRFRPMLLVIRVAPPVHAQSDAKLAHSESSVPNDTECAHVGLLSLPWRMVNKHHSSRYDHDDDVAEQAVFPPRLLLLKTKDR